MRVKITTLEYPQVPIFRLLALKKYSDEHIREEPFILGIITK